MGVNYFDHENLSELGFTDDADGKYARCVLLPLIEQGTRPFFNNVDCQMAVLEVDGLLLPISITSKNAAVKNAFVSVSYTHLTLPTILLV